MFNVTEYTLPINSNYDDLDLDYYDNYDSKEDIILIIKTGEINYSLVGEYSLNIELCDTSNNCSTTEITITIEDNESPIINTSSIEISSIIEECNYQNRISVDDESTYTIKIDDSNVKYGVPGVYEIIISATDSSNNITINTIPLYVYSLIITLNEQAIKEISFENIIDTHDNFINVSTINGSLNEDIYFETNYSFDSDSINAPGEYIFKYYIDLEDKLLLATRTITVLDTTCPILTNTDVSKYTINYGEEFNPLTYFTAIDNVDGDITTSIEHSKFNNVMGTQEIVVKVTDSSGNETTDIIILEVDSNKTIASKIAIYGGGATAMIICFALIKKKIQKF